MIRPTEPRGDAAIGNRVDLPAGVNPFDLIEGMFQLTDHVCVVILDSNAKVLWTSESIYLPSDASCELPVGITLAEFLPGRWAQERLECSRLALERHCTISLFSIWDGHRILTRFTAISAGDERVVLCVCEPSSREAMNAAIAADTDDVVRVSNSVKLGPLEVLTARELEVLSLIGEGLRSKDIAAKLSRSVSTVEGHRERIGQKLSIHDRAELFLMARTAGLRLEDANAERVRYPADRST